MTVLIQNITDKVKYVYRFNGTKLHILPNDFITFDVNDSVEMDFWNTQSLNGATRGNGIVVIVDPNRIKIIKKLKACGKYNKHQKVDNSNKSKNINKTVNTINDTTNNTNDKKIDEVKSIEVNEPIVNTINNVLDFESINSSNILDESFYVSDNTEISESLNNIELTTNDSTISVETDSEVNKDIEQSISITEYLSDESSIVSDNNIDDSDIEINNVDELTNCAEPKSYTVDNLNTLTKSELQEILDSLNIPYKKNNSINTLISLILNNCEG